MQKREIDYFIGTLGSKGYVSFFDSNFGPLKKKLCLRGYPEQAVERLTERVRAEAEKRALSCEVIHRFLDGRPEGIILPELGTGLINTPVWLLGEDSFCAITEEESVRQTKRALSDAADCFRQAKKIHDDWEKIYIANMNFDAANRLAEDWGNALLGERRGSGSGRITDRFLGAATADGPTDMIERITEALSRRYFIKGRPGTGKSTFLQRLVRRASEAGFDVERYHCSFDPDSLDMAVVRELDVCLFDSTAPHEYFPSRPTDEIIDIYACAVTPGTDERFRRELEAFAADYKFKALEAGKALARARASQEKTEAACAARTDWAAFEQACERFCNELLAERL